FPDRPIAPYPAHRPDEDTGIRRRDHAVDGGHAHALGKPEYGAVKFSAHLVQGHAHQAAIVHVSDQPIPREPPLADPDGLAGRRPHIAMGQPGYGAIVWKALREIGGM